MDPKTSRYRAGDRAKGAVMATDSYFEFPDGVEMAAEAGITAVVQPGGALREKGIDFRPADLLDSARLTESFSPADCVIHCAAKSADWD